MRLINTNTLDFEEYIGRNTPPYAILSHTWEEDEVSFQKMKQESRAGMKGFKKIQNICSLAKKGKIEYAWVDTCCIDKSSSAELTEAINSMFKWYERATICYVWLSDLTASADLDTDLKKCRWFTRGWTLQELIAPKSMNFYNRDWKFVGRKMDLIQQLSEATSIPITVLLNTCSLQDVAICEKMFWAAERETTRIEDMAYCLLGIFDINMPLLYGEEEKAFRRLQEEIIKTTPDMSIFAWAAKRTGTLHSGTGSGCSTTSNGIKISDYLYHLPAPGRAGRQLVLPVTEDTFTRKMGVRLKKTINGSLVREDPYTLAEFVALDLNVFRQDLCLSTNTPKLHEITTSDTLSSGRCVRFRMPSNMKIINAWPWEYFVDEDYELVVPMKNYSGAVLLSIESHADEPIEERSEWNCMFIFCGDAYDPSRPTISCSIVDYDEFTMKLDRITARMLRHERVTNKQMRNSLTRSVPQTSTTALVIPETGQSAVVSFTLEQVIATPSAWSDPVLVVRFAVEFRNSRTVTPAEDKHWTDVYKLSDPRLWSFHV
ncbi:vegetative incompatibility protein HET-E-1 [Colletotrichum spaethianum]|uniref:Vegetative incompatibility protein HET-E-1 n=1 Tax=Colletotrichum spaethianum TaxID=700344 RepID=A0AA37L6G7_9PEZI|nr:vegetative incompatibility protein HET-E-1 [Colletotrichum spaethianum]GKT42661.1 vegetative incompatibility protein HET-E-1 [Colletotrichum spaethianum]